MARTRTQPHQTADVIVVGAGSAGGALAARLSEDPSQSVLLVEAGPDFGSAAAGQPPEVLDPEDASPTRYDWGHEARAASVGRRMPLYAGRLVGGSSATNNVMALRGHRSAYDDWARAGCDGWSYRQVLPAFKRSERDLDFDGDEHGARGPVAIRRAADGELTAPQEAFLEACAAAGHPPVADHNAADAVGAGPLPTNDLGGVRLSVALTYLAEARTRPNLTIRAEAEVSRVLAERGCATGVELADGERLHGDRVVLCAGAIGSPAILLRSGIGPADELAAHDIPVQHDLRGVGANLHDHPLLRLPFSVGQPPALHARQTLLTARSGPDSAGPDIQVLPSGPAPAEDGSVLTLLVAVMTPRARGRLRLGASGLDIDPDYLGHPDDVRRMVAGVRLARDIAATEALRSLIEGELWPGPHITGDAQLAEAVLARTLPYHHPAGTCRMGPADDPEAVVDPRGRVHGIERLSVVDASVMPSLPCANTNLPTLMVAEHLHRYL